MYQWPLRRAAPQHFEVLAIEGKAMPVSAGRSRGRSGGPARRKLVKAKRKSDKVKRKVKRSR
ncbi:MAG: hypothetical protein WBA92_10240 [Pseudorhodobacter sp.]